MIYTEAVSLIDSGVKIADAKTKLNSKYGLRGAQLALKMIDEHKKMNHLGVRYEAVEKLVGEFIGTREKVSGIRDIWYQIKHNIQVYQHPLQTEKEFSDAITDEIGSYLWKVFTTEDCFIYSNLGINTKRIELGSQPIVLFVEKELPDYDFIKDEIQANVYVSSGQPNLFEFAQLAEATEYDDEIFLVTMTDFDAARLTIAQTTATNLQLAANAFYGARVNHISVDLDWFSYPTYQMSADQVKKKIWTYGEFGVELNAIPIADRQRGIIEALDAVVNLEVFEELAIERRKQLEFEKALEESKDYRDAIKAKNKIVRRIRTEVENAEYDFNTDRFDSFASSSVVDMCEKK